MSRSSPEPRARHPAIVWLRLQLWRPLRAATAPLLYLHVPALERNGWLRSRRERRCIDRDGRPLPWITYPAIHLLASRVHAGLDVFEYGAGASTLWWAARVRSVTSVDHDPGWARWAGAAPPPNATVRHVPLDETPAYASAVREGGRAYDAIVIDGRRRVACVPFALAALAPGGVIVFDNTDRPEYEPGLRALAAAGFRRLDLVGMAPLIDYESMTSVFYRDGSWLGL